jgi:hypothetical protein
MLSASISYFKAFEADIIMYYKKLCSVLFLLASYRKKNIYRPVLIENLLFPNVERIKFFLNMSLNLDGLI